MNPIDPFDFDQRRQAILQLALRHADARRHRRWIVRAGGVAVVALIAISIILLPKTPQPNMPRPSDSVAIHYLQTDPHILDRLSTPSAQPAWTTINDDELLKTLADAGQPAGLIYVDGRAVLVQ